MITIYCILIAYFEKRNYGVVVIIITVSTNQL